ncbi:MAG: hypothetical protein ABIF19_06370 [Planctomycetota bacterium]
MGGFTDYWEDKILDHIFGKAVYAPPTIYVGLSTSNPQDDGSGLAEPDGNAYARVQTSPGDWSAASGGVVQNAGDVTFAKATGNWGTITHFALFDAATGGNMLAHGALSQAMAVGSSETARFAAGDLDIGLD